MAHEKICIDIGTVNTRVWTSSKGDIFNEPTCLTLSRKTGEVIEIGYLASYSADRNSADVVSFSPMVQGVVGDIDLVTLFLKQIFINQHLEKILKKSIIYVSAPSVITSVEKNALLTSIKQLGAKRIEVVSACRAAAYGSGVDFSSPKGIMVLDIGGGISDCAVLVMGQSVSSDTIKIGGNDFDKAIIKFFKKYKNMLIGKVTAQTVKMRICSISESSENQFFQVAGKDIVTGLPVNTVISTNELKPILVGLSSEIADLSIDLIKNVKPELASDLTRTGMLVTGSGALLGGMKEFLETKLSMPIHFASDMANGVIAGLQKLAKDEK